MKQIKLYKYQEDALNWALKKKKASIYFDMGLGKTVIICNLINKLSGPVLISCPKNAVNTWINHLKDICENRKIIILDKGEKKNTVFLNENQIKERYVVIASYAQLKPLLFILRLIKFNAFIIDESHAIRNWSQLTRAVITIGKNIPYKYLLSGTPTGNKYNLDYYHQLKFIEAIQMNKEEFRNRFVVIEENYHYGLRRVLKKYVGNKNEDELNEILSKCTIRMVKVNETNKQQIFFENGKYYRVFIRDKVLKGDKFLMFADNSSKKYYQLRILASGIVEDSNNKNFHLISLHKFKWIVEKLEALKNKRVIIWYNYRIEYRALYELLKLLKRPIAVYSGEIKLMGLWDLHEDCILLAQTKSASLSLNELVTSNNVIYFSPPESLIDYQQSLKRTDRIGQTKICNYWFLTTEKSIEPLIYEKLFASVPFKDIDFHDHWNKHASS